MRFTSVGQHSLFYKAPHKPKRHNRTSIKTLHWWQHGHFFKLSVSAHI